LGVLFLSWIIFSSVTIICLPFFIKIFTLVICIIGGIFGYLIRNINFYFFNKSLNFYLFSFINSSIWFMPLISTIGIVFYPLSLGFNSLKSFDQGWSEFIGGQNLYSSITYVSIINQNLQNNNLKIYLIIFVFWIIFLILFMII